LEVPAGPINTVDKAVADPQVLSRNMVVEIDSPHVGRTKDVGSPIKVSGVDQVKYVHPPALGEHTEQVLKDILGYAAGKIATLRKQKVI
jgi:formyl-CoA transferase